MLSKQAIGTSLPLISNLEQRNIGVCPVENTLLDKLVRASQYDIVSPVDMNGDVNIDLAADLPSRTDETTGYSEHDVAMTEVADAIATAVGGHLNFARTVVAPVVNDLVEKIQKHAASIMHDNMLDLEIKQMNLPGPLLEPAIIDSIEANKVSRTAYPGNRIRMVIPTVDEIIEQMKTGAASADKAIETYAHTLGDEKLVRIYSILFAGNDDLTATVASSFTPSEPDLYNTEDGLDIALVGFLISRRIWSEPPEGVEMNLKTYEDEMVKLRNESAGFLSTYIYNFQRNVDAGILINGYTSTTVMVNAPVYKKWIENGGKNEIIFGNLVTASPSMTVEDISIRADELIKNWENFCAIHATTQSNRRFVAMKEIVALEFGASIAEASEEDLPLNEREAVMNRFKAELANTCEEDITPECLNLWILKLVCNSRYYTTDAYRIISSIDSIVSRNPSIDVKEAASIAATEYIVYWLASQMKLYSITNSGR